MGKTVILANTAISLAQQGKRCVALDLDLGGANLHTVLGVSDPDRSLSDFLRRKVESLSDTMVPTPYPNLNFISGSKALLEIANPKFSQKEKLIRHIMSLDVDYVLLDLGAGSAFNTLDFFLSADEGVLVVLPEPTSVENAYHFIKAAFYVREFFSDCKGGQLLCNPGYHRYDLGWVCFTFNFLTKSLVLSNLVFKEHLIAYTHFESAQN